MNTERLQPRAIAYEPQFDQRIGLKASYLSRQIDTFVGERLNVLLSKIKYEIKNNLIYGQDMDEPFIDVMKRGVDYRRKVEGENRVDKNREEAEVEGFLKTQEILCNPETPIGTMILSISPQGEENSLYQHNFYDIFTLKEEKGQRFIEARRYSSALSTDEYKDKLKPLHDTEKNIDDAYFLSHPVKIDNGFFENADEIHSYLHKDHKTTELGEFERIIKTCDLLKQEYIRTKDPRVLDAIMNKADLQAGLIDLKHDRLYDFLIGPSKALTVDQEIDFLGRQIVRAAASGCGPSNGFSNEKSISSPFSVSDFGIGDDKFGSREFECPECGKTNIRPKDELIKKCQHCNSSKVAC